MLWSKNGASLFCTYSSTHALRSQGQAYQLETHAHQMFYPGHAPEPFTSRFPPSAAHMIKGLLVSNPIKRLGNQSGGIQDIMNHHFFKECGLDWDELYNKRLTPPHKPKVRVAAVVAALLESLSQHISGRSQKVSSNRSLVVLRRRFKGGREFATERGAGSSGYLCIMT